MRIDVLVYDRSIIKKTRYMAKDIDIYRELNDLITLVGDGSEKSLVPNYDLLIEQSIRLLEKIRDSKVEVETGAFEIVGGYFYAFSHLEGVVHFFTTYLRHQLRQRSDANDIEDALMKRTLQFQLKAIEDKNE